LSLIIVFSQISNRRWFIRGDIGSNWQKYPHHVRSSVAAGGLRQ